MSWLEALSTPAFDLLPPIQTLNDFELRGGTFVVMARKAHGLIRIAGTGDLAAGEEWMLHLISTLPGDLDVEESTK